MIGEIGANTWRRCRGVIQAITPRFLLESRGYVLIKTKPDLHLDTVEIQSRPRTLKKVLVANRGEVAVRIGEAITPPGERDRHTVDRFLRRIEAGLNAVAGEMGAP